MKNNGYKNGERRNNNRKGGYRKNNPFSEAERQQREQKRQEILERQNTELEVINEVMCYLNDCVDKNNNKVTVKDILSMLESAGYSRDDIAVKSIGQYNYILLDLAKEVMNKYIDDDRVELRSRYIKERLLSAFNKHYHEYILNLFNFYTSLSNTHVLEDEMNDGFADTAEDIHVEEE